MTKYLSLRFLCVLSVSAVRFVLFGVTSWIISDTAEKRFDPRIPHETTRRTPQRRRERRGSAESKEKNEPQGMSKVLITTLFLAAVTSVFAQNDMSRFITRSGGKLMEGEKEYRFISFNIPNLHLVEDNMTFEATNEWRFPDEFEITDALTTIRQMGGRVARTYVISICKKTGPNPMPCHVKRPGEFNEEAFRALDKVLEVANRVGVRVIIPLVDNWKWWGGIDQYAEYRGKTGVDFWTDQDLIDDFKKTVEFMINRRNTYTGTLYKDDKSILAWETGNEILPPYSWTKQIASYIKALDTNHLVWDGFYIGTKEIQPEVLADPNIDIVSSHHYPSQNKGPDEMVADVKRFRDQIQSRKVYVLGEFGFIPPNGIEKVLNAVISEGLSGAMIWSLRFHNRDGGFYWHSEPASASLYNPYHYPGFPSGEGWNETATLNVMRTKAFEIQGLKLPNMEVPGPPKLLPITSPAEISWQGSVGASRYDVERSDDRDGPWEDIGKDVDDTWVRYRPLFSDSTAQIGQSYYYRLLAKNRAGISAPSNVVGPVKVTQRYVIDELLDFSKVFAHDGTLTLESANARPYKEDPHRVKGTDGDSLVYRSTGSIHSATILTLMEGAEKQFEFYASNDDKTFQKVTPKVSRYGSEANLYGYKLPVKYELDLPADSYYLKIAFTGDAQISRVELRYGN